MIRVIKDGWSDETEGRKIAAIRINGMASNAVCADILYHYPALFLKIMEDARIPLPNLTA